MRDNLKEKEKLFKKKRTTKEKKAKRDNLGDNQKVQLTKYEKEVTKVMHVNMLTSIMKKRG